MSAELEIFRVADDFAQLIRLREIMLSEGEDVGPLEATIAEYFSHDVTRDKIDTVIGFLRHAEIMELAAKTEADRTRKLAESWKSQREYLKGCVQQVMELSGKKLLEGKTAGTLRLKGNGGRQAVTITDASLIPEELVQYTGTISGDAWEYMESVMLGTGNFDWLERQDVQMERIPHKGRIGEALSNGESVAGARLEERGSHVEIR